MQTHDLKVHPDHFDGLASGAKLFELRLNDRLFEVGDILLLREWYGRRYTGRQCVRRITYMVTDQDGPWLSPRYVCLGLSAPWQGMETAPTTLEQEIMVCDNSGRVYFAFWSQSGERWVASCGGETACDYEGGAVFLKPIAWLPRPRAAPGQLAA